MKRLGLLVAALALILAIGDDVADAQVIRSRVVIRGGRRAVVVSPAPVVVAPRRAVVVAPRTTIVTPSVGFAPATTTVVDRFGRLLDIDQFGNVVRIR